MKAIILILLVVNIRLLSFIQNQNHVANLSFDILEDSSAVYKKIVLKDNLIEFYIESNLFRGDVCSKKEFSENQISGIQIVSISQFKNQADVRRRNKIAQSKELGRVQILLNHEVFDTVYIYVREKNKIFRYNVKWIEQIE